MITERDIQMLPLFSESATSLLKGLLNRNVSWWLAALPFIAQETPRQSWRRYKWYQKAPIFLICELGRNDSQNSERAFCATYRRRPRRAQYRPHVYARVTPRNPRRLHAFVKEKIRGLYLCGDPTKWLRPRKPNALNGLDPVRHKRCETGEGDSK